MIVEIFKELKNMTENQTGKRLKILRTDNGTEYCYKAMNQLQKPRNR